MNMRALLQTTAICAFLTLSSFTLRAQDTSDQVVEVVFTQDMDVAALKRIQEEVKAEGIELAYTNKNFLGGQLHEIAFSVVTAKGSGKANGPITADRRFGFRYDPRPGAEVPFSVGTLDAPQAPAPRPVEEH